MAHKITTLKHAMIEIEKTRSRVLQFVEHSKQKDQVSSLLTFCEVSGDTINKLSTLITDKNNIAAEKLQKDLLSVIESNTHSIQRKKPDEFDLSVILSKYSWVKRIVANSIRSAFRETITFPTCELKTKLFKNELNYQLNEQLMLALHDKDTDGSLIMYLARKKDKMIEAILESYVDKQFLHY